MSGLLVTIINDCRDDDARVRQENRVAALLPDTRHISFCGVGSTLEAAGCLVDALDALLGAEAIVLVNVAPRNGEARQWANGSPFGWTRVGRTLILGTVQGYTFSLLQKVLGEPLIINVFEFDAAVDALGLDPATAARVKTTQFRSYEFLPRVAAALVAGKEIPTAPFDDVPDPPDGIWFVDGFGNLKTTLLENHPSFCADNLAHVSVSGDVETGGTVECDAICYHRLKDVPDGKLGIVVGSSGLGDRRFLELVVQGGSAARRFDIRHSGARIHIEP
ncbi:MAG: hypothetical protein A3C90_03135 [Candidatus Magasanikbacteria bacterium RIFCSPHIGHO2_02_FULL_51_14]|uniref:Uncharacterized protein n=1 Tax=Candidatus Magasanikbacteria bacterium RIFCSPHIGHO2_02_FULL_51_14 TaxID=1798683 RepID=A0A1F6MNV9_9BACT|nr:MAG: hypothetical protein A3C90_03135 [Candidatus Magasanikbacteria bacterium RIFCSPHIGHO2_02_FULL_51_14]